MLLLGMYALTQGLFLVAEVLAIRAGIASPSEGLLGAERSDFFFFFGGLLLIVYSLLLGVMAGRPYSG